MSTARTCLVITTTFLSNMYSCYHYKYFQTQPVYDTWRNKHANSVSYSGNHGSLLLLLIHGGQLIFNMPCLAITTSIQTGTLLLEWQLCLSLVNHLTKQQGDHTPDKVKFPDISPTFCGIPTHAVLATSRIYHCQRHQYTTHASAKMFTII